MSHGEIWDDIWSLEKTNIQLRRDLKQLEQKMEKLSERLERLEGEENTQFITRTA